MKLFRIHGGVHPDYRKERTRGSPIVQMPIPRMLGLPLQQHVGTPADPVVESGQRVRKGQLLALAHGTVSAAVHAPTSGHVVAIVDALAPHASGLSQKTILLRSDGLDQWADLEPPLADPFAAEPHEIAARVAAAGVVGLGGAAFPAAVKLSLRAGHQVDLLVINGAECEPYLTGDDRLMREHAAQVIDGARIMAYALGAERIVVAIEANKPEAIEAVGEVAREHERIEVVTVPVRYPMGSAHHLVKVLTGRETPAHGRTASVGVVVHNVGTARAVHQAVRLGQPLISRVITVSGDAMTEARNIEVLLGTPVSDLIDFCGGFAERPARVINGGPMMGLPLPSLDVPVVKGMCGVLALAPHETNEQPAGPCLRCGECISACPSRLVPMEMAALIRREDLEGADRAGVRDCITCGSCSYVCPAHIPLMHYFDYANGRLRAGDRDQIKQKALKMLAEARQARMERQARAKREATTAMKEKGKAAAAAPAAGREADV